MNESKRCSPDWCKCTFCKAYDAPANMRARGNVSHYHRACKNEHDIKSRAAKKQAALAVAT